MAGAKEIRTKIKSVQNTRKITRAMEMVAASKMRKAQERMFHARPYAQKMRQVIGHVAAANSEYKHPFLITHPDISRVGYIVISTDRGLCGGLNNNLFRQLVFELDAWRERGIDSDFCIIGNKGAAFFSRMNVNLLAAVTQIGDIPKAQDLFGAVKLVMDRYAEGTVDRVYIAYNDFVNSMTQHPVIEQLLPREPADEPEIKHRWDYIYEPDAHDVLDHLLRRYIESLVYQAVLENIASEQAARMVAMKAASDNAGDLIDELQLQYNKARQAAITQELSEIVSGAAAI